MGRPKQFDYTAIAKYVKEERAADPTRLMKEIVDGAVAKFGCKKRTVARAVSNRAAVPSASADASALPKDEFPDDASHPMDPGDEVILKGDFEWTRGRLKLIIQSPSADVPVLLFRLSRLFKG